VDREPPADTPLADAEPDFGLLAHEYHGQIDIGAFYRIARCSPNGNIAPFCTLDALP